jgi:hypothetical protein
MTHNLTLQDVLGVFVLDEARLPEDEDNYFQIDTLIEFFMDEQGKPTFLFYHITVDNYADNYRLKAGHFTLLPESQELELIFDEGFERLIHDKPRYLGDDYSPKTQRSYASLMPKERWTIDKDEQLSFECEGRYYVPAEKHLCAERAQVSRFLRKMYAACKAGEELEKWDCYDSE